MFNVRKKYCNNTYGNKYYIKYLQPLFQSC